MWIATHGGGLVRHDGYAYRYFGVGNDGCLCAVTPVITLWEDKFHRLWISFDEYTEVLDLKTMKTVVPDSKNDVLRGILNQLPVKVYCDSKDALWIVNRSFIYHVTLDQRGESCPYIADWLSWQYSRHSFGRCRAERFGVGGHWRWAA